MKKENQKLITALFIVSAGLVLFFNLSAKSLENNDRLRYAEVAREMIRSGDWVVPHFNGRIYIDKPPLLFWLMAIPAWLHGAVTPWIARLPSALSAWVGAVILFLWARRLYGSVESGLISGSVLLTSLQYFFEARGAKTDLLVCVMVLLSLYFFWLGYDGGRRKGYLFFGLSFFFMGLGVLTKGPLGVAFPMLVVAVFLLKEKRMKLLVSREFMVGYLILGITVLPWIVLFVKAVGWEQTLELVRSTQILTRKDPIYFYVIRIWSEFFPWSLLLPFLFLFFWRKRGERLEPGESFSLIWFLTVFLALTLFKYRAARYLLPALPPFALMIGGMMRRKRLSLVLIPACLFVLIWHGVEFYWFTRDSIKSPGRVLAGELRPVLGSSVLYGYRLEEITVQGINFYLDRIIPVIKKGEALPEKKMILMPEKVYQDLRSTGLDSLSVIREFQYGKGKLILVSS